MMKIGFLTGCLGDMPLKEKARFAGEAGFDAIEVSCWPQENDRDYSACDIDVEHLNQSEAEDVKGYMKEYGLFISALAYYDNTLDVNAEKRAFVNRHIHKVIDAAEMLEVELVGVFIGKDISKSLEENFQLFQDIFSELVDYAEQRNVKLMIENCHMPNWLEPGRPGTFSYSPELWAEMFRRVPSENFGLNYDPSHLKAMLMDPIKCLEGFENRVLHMHAKDVEVFPEKLAQYGIYNGSFGDSYWRYRMPSLGQIDWGELTSYMQEHGYDSVISIEHEDHLYEGSPERVMEGLRIALAHLKKVIQ